MYRSAVFPGDDVDRDRSASPSSPCIIQCSIRAHVGIGERMHGREVRRRRRRRTQADKQRDGGVRERALARAYLWHRSRRSTCCPRPAASASGVPGTYPGSACSALSPAATF